MGNRDKMERLLSLCSLFGFVLEGKELFNGSKSCINSLEVISLDRNKTLNNFKAQTPYCIVQSLFVYENVPLKLVYLQCAIP